MRTHTKENVAIADELLLSHEDENAFIIQHPKWHSLLSYGSFFTAILA